MQTNSNFTNCGSESTKQLCVLTYCEEQTTSKIKTIESRETVLLSPVVTRKAKKPSLLLVSCSPKVKKRATLKDMDRGWALAQCEVSDACNIQKWLLGHIRIRTLRSIY